MAGAVLRLMHDPALRATLGGNGAQHARRRYDRDLMVDRYLSWYGDVLASHPMAG